MRTRVTLATATALLLAGCGDPYVDRPPPSPPSGELAAPPVARDDERLAPDAPLPAPAAVAERAAKLTTNWTSDTAAANYARLAELSAGSARDDFAQAAASLPTDPEPTTHASGRLEAITERTRGDRSRLIVVTRETTRGDGLRDSRWRVTLATAEQRTGGWVLTEWQPQP